MRQGGPSKEKARKMLSEGIAQGRKLSDKQRKYFGYLANRQRGGVWDQNGYLASNSDNFTPVKVIQGNTITTEGMAFPIMANGRPLYPDTGEYTFPNTNQVIETPMKKGGKYRYGYQMGGSRQPIITNDPNDPRLRAYQDSLDLYNLGENRYQAAKKFGKIQAENKIVEIKPNSEKLIPYNDYINEYHNGRRIMGIINKGTNEYMYPENVSRYRGSGLMGFLNYGAQGRYKKPEQPVLLNDSLPIIEGSLRPTKKITTIPAPRRATPATIGNSLLPIEKTVGQPRLPQPYSMRGGNPVYGPGNQFIGNITNSGDTFYPDYGNVGRRTNSDSDLLRNQSALQPYLDRRVGRGSGFTNIQPEFPELMQPRMKKGGTPCFYCGGKYRNGLK